MSADIKPDDQTHRTSARAPSLVSMQAIIKSYGPTLANAGIDLTIEPGEVIGLVGGNGAGKSTLMKILCGGTSPDGGSIFIDGTSIDPRSYGPAASQKLGIRMVHQELSLCGNLSVAENFFLEAPSSTPPAPGWRAAHRASAQAALDEVFPKSRIDVGTEVDDFSIGEKQMVEIARAAADTSCKLIVLDEPTSSLDKERSDQLRAYIRKRSAQGTAFIFISHKLHEVIDISTRVVVLRNGTVTWHGVTKDASIAKLVSLMGGTAETAGARARLRTTQASNVVVQITGALVGPLGRDVEIRQGEIIGLAGLEGSGQKEFLQRLLNPKAPSSDGVQRQTKTSFIAGDRRKEGIFPLWTVLSTMSIGRIARRGPFSFVSDREERSAAKDPAQQLRLDASRFNSNILELSGGNQQKALVARALLAKAPVILLDDPTRGVDIATKHDFYDLCGRIAGDGHALIWHSTEDSELLIADRILVFSHGKIVDELEGERISEKQIVASSFSQYAKEAQREEIAARKGVNWRRWSIEGAPFAGLAIVLATMMFFNPSVASVFGLDLLLMPVVSLALISVAQMFIIGGSEIDLGVGPFAALISVLAATLLYDQPLLGIGAIALAIAAYTCLGALIQLRKIPAIVVTLGASFIWGGISYSLQPTPGGTSPEWLTGLVSWSIPDIPTSIILLVLIGVVATIIDRMPLGVTFRGFGNHASAMTRSGWNATAHALLRYFIAGIFAALGGLSLTAINASSDSTSGNSYTLLSVAAVVMGGASLIGGRIFPAGVIAGATTLSLIGALLGVLNVSGDMNAATQGFVLIALLALRSIFSWKKAEA